jgi:hypothetical protein
MMKNKVLNKCSIHSCFFKNTRGELTTQQIIGLVILVTSFVVILILLARLDLGETSNSQICHNSVVLRDKSNFKTETLDCKTNYLCVSGGDDCIEGNYDSTIKIGLTQKELFGVLAEELVDCWWMFGEGALDYVDWDFVGKSNHCAICSAIRFDSSIQENFIESITLSEFYNFLSTNTIEGKQETYLKYLYGVEDVDLLEGKNLSQMTFDFTNKYLVVTGKDSGKDNIFAQLITSEEISSSNICEKFDLTKA